MNFKHIILLFVSMACFAGCQPNETDRIENLVRKWINKEVLFPEHPVFTRFTTDTVSYTIPDSEYKVLMYVDSTGCISCKLQLLKWKKFMSEVDSLSNEEVSFVFFFQPKNIRELRYILKRDNFSYPVCIDIDGKFNALNHFPDQMEYQAFLLDADNRVKVIGNPIHNQSIKELYLQELTGATARVYPLTTLLPDSSEYHFGMLDREETLRKVVRLSNAGKVPFHIKGITTSCDCLSVEYNWDEIPPGKDASVTVSYKAEQPGDFWRTITIYGNVPDESITLDFWGTVR